MFLTLNSSESIRLTVLRFYNLSSRVIISKLKQIEHIELFQTIEYNIGELIKSNDHSNFFFDSVCFVGLIFYDS